MASQDLQITAVTPSIGVAGGEIGIHCDGFQPASPWLANVMFGEVAAHVVSASEDFVVARVPESPNCLGITLKVGDQSSRLFPFTLALKLATGLHPVTSPVISQDGSIITTISGSRGQQTPEPLVRIDQRQLHRPRRQLH